MCSRGYYKQKVNIYSSIILCIQATDPSRFKYFIVNQLQTTKYSQRAIIDAVMNISMPVQQHRKRESPCDIFNMRSLGVEGKNNIMTKQDHFGSFPTNSVPHLLTGLSQESHSFHSKAGRPRIGIARRDLAWSTMAYHTKTCLMVSTPMFYRICNPRPKFVRCT